MILALILSFAATLSSAVPAPRVDSAAISPISLVPLNKSSSPSLAIPEPNYRPPDTTSRKWNGIVSESTPKEPAPGFVSRTLYSTAIMTSGVLLTYAGIAYWQHPQAANHIAEKAGVNPLGLMAVATISIPVGAALALVGGAALVGNLVGMGGSETDPDRE